MTLQFNHFHSSFKFDLFQPDILPPNVFRIGASILTFATGGKVKPFSRLKSMHGADGGFKMS